MEKNIEFIEKLVHINRITKVVKGGRRFGFAAIMIVGDNKGRVVYGTGKAKEVPEAVRKATEDAKNKVDIIKFDLIVHTSFVILLQHHDLSIILVHFFY